MNEQIYAQLLDNETVSQAENILADIGLDYKTFLRMCVKKLIKEKNISFLISSSTYTPKDSHSVVEESTTKQEENGTMNNVNENQKKKITPIMRDCIWDIFKSQFLSDGKINYPFSEKLAITKSGISQGSAHIYFLFLSNLLSAISNTRVVKISDLEVYLKNIKEQLPKIYLENALKSLADSVQYWKTQPTLRSFADKVLILIIQFR